MKRSLTVVCMLAFAMAAGLFCSPYRAAAQAEPPSAPSPSRAIDAPTVPAGPSKVAVIVFQQAVAQTNEGQRNLSQLRQKFEPKQAELKAKSDEIDTLKKQLQAAGATLSEDERSTRLKTIDEKTKALQRDAEDDQNDFNTEMQDTYQPLAQKLYKVLDAYAKRHGYTIVLDASNQQTSPVLWVNPATDITKEVVAAYNAESGIAAPAAHTGATTPPRTGTTHSTHPSTTRAR